jgi:hypothetical protein
MKKSSYRKVVRYSAMYDVVMTFAFAFPVLAVWNINLLSDIHIQYAFSGSIPEFQPLHLFFVNLLGSVVLVWSAIRIYKPEAILGLYDSFARFLFSFNMLYYLLMHDVTGLLWVIFIPEVTWGFIQFFGYFYSQKIASSKQINQN